MASLNLVGAFKGLSLSSTSSFLRGDLGPITGSSKLCVSFPLKSLPLTIESAHKKGAGSTKNGRDSRGQRLGVKIYGDQVANARRNHRPAARYQVPPREECGAGQGPHHLFLD